MKVNRPIQILENKYQNLKSNIKTEINDKFVTYFSSFQQKKKKKIKDIYEKRHNIDHNCQLALNCIYNEYTQNGVPQNTKFKSVLQSVKKDKSKSKQRESASKSKIQKSSEASQRYK